MRPAGLTAVCIIALCLGVFGGFGVLAGCAGLVFAPVIEKFSTDFQKSMIGANNPQMQKQLEGQQKMMEEMRVVQKKWLVPSLIGMVISAVAVVGLIVGSIKGLNLRPMAHRWLIVGMTAGIVHALIAAYIGVAMQQDTQAVMMRFMNQTLQAGPAATAPGAKAIMNSSMQLSTTLAVVLAFGWALIKLSCYGVCIWYLLTPRIRQLFEGDGSERAVIDALSETPT